MKLSVKFSLVISSLLFVTTTLMVSININQNSMFLKDAIKKKGKTLAHTAAISSLDSFLKKDYAALYRYCISIAYDEDVENVAILDSNYVVKMNDDLLILGDSWSDRITFPTDGYITLMPITLAETYIGYVYIKMTDENIHDELQSLILKNILVGIAFTLVGIALALLMAKKITTPLNSLTEFASRVSDGNFESSFVYQSSDEVGILANSFRLMISNIKGYIDSRTRNERLTIAGRLSSAMAHEIRNSLEPMKGAVTMLRLKNPDNQWVKRYSDIIEDEVNELSGYIWNFLDFTRSGEPSLQKTDINKLIIDIKNLTIDYIRQHNNDLVLNLNKQKIEGFFDPHHIKQVIMNLIVNSVQALESKSGIIEISAQLLKITEKEFIEIKVSDNGIGIEDEMLQHLSQPYYTSKKEGTGLGLFISQLLIEKNSGSIKIDSSYGKWTLITITIPIEREL